MHVVINYLHADDPFRAVGAVYAAAFTLNKLVN